MPRSAQYKKALSSVSRDNNTSDDINNLLFVAFVPQNLLIVLGI